MSELVVVGMGQYVTPSGEGSEGASFGSHSAYHSEIRGAVHHAIVHQTCDEVRTYHGEIRGAVHHAIVNQTCDEVLPHLRAESVTQQRQTV